MPAPTVIRFEATEIEPSLMNGHAMLIMTTKEGRIGVVMQRPVFDALFVQMRHALVQGTHDDPPPTAA